MNIGLVMRRSLRMNQYMVPAVFSLVLAISACGKQEQHLAPATGSESVGNQVEQKVNAAAISADRERQDFLAKAERQMDEVNAKIAKLEERSANATVAAKAKLEQELKALDEEMRVAEQRLSEFKSATVDKWKDLEAGVSSAIERVKRLVDKAIG